MRHKRPHLAPLFSLLATVIGAAPGAHAQEQAAWRLEEALGAPDWLTLRGEARARYETLDGQFRAGGAGGDQALALRTLLLAEIDAGDVSFGAEVQDSRVYLDDAGTPLSTSIVDPIDLLQAYARIDLDGVLHQRRASLTLGRQTLDIGSRRILERVEMANVIFAYTGAYWRSENDRGDEWHALIVSPLGRLPNDRQSLGDNIATADEEEWGRIFWGVHYRRANVLDAAAGNVWIEIFLYGLDEQDTARVPTPNRHYVQPGFRVYRAPALGQWDMDVEASHRTGSRRETSNPADRRDLDVSASALHAHFGYTFDHAWRPRLAIDYDFASGDDSPNDDAYNQYERLFGSRRTDLGNTGIYGPLTPANLSAPGARIELTPSARLDLRIAYKAAYLESGSDAWVVARVRDPSGASGRFIGHAIDSRLRYWIEPGATRIEIGASALIMGAFAENAPNASGQGDALFGYFQYLKTF